ncbi:phosphodiester glycosidase family protein [Pedobacter sp. BS3]|uniref:phosphodiester glycosidase family protein n=1 Tax=Pedobacter sp. BS3 TaxID=2567937 RepID=UPI0011EC7DC2|nr:phosphodiester glycosidase family protein [Pedobacter sp. BS3]TZF81829.1 phosphodiester glycosidase family protein [Pedobacter sp. BS3]
MKKRYPYMLIGMLVISASLGCKKSRTGNYRPEIPVIKIDSTPLIDLPAYWKKDVSRMAGFPNGIQVYQANTLYSSKSLVAYAIVFDPLRVEFKPVVAQENKKPSTFYSAEPGAFACINAGFFGTNASYSLVLYNNVVGSVNIKSLTRTYNGANATYYPTRGALGITTDGVPDISWIYHVGSGNGTIYAYPAPSPNDVTKAPQAVPTATFPSGGKIWDAVNAVGGSPVLIKNGTVTITDTEELIVIDNTSSRARSAIGYTANGKMLIVAVEGNNPAGGTGLNLSELAQLMKDMGCVGALNLDGGGSTDLIINGKQTVRPSDGSERAVMSAVILKSK